MSYADNCSVCVQPSYPSGRVVQYDYDDAGRAKAVTGASGTYVSQASYVSHGGLAQVTYGNNLVEKRGYNAVMQPVSITVGTTASVVDRLSLQLSYCSTPVPDCGTNNGNVLTQGMDAVTQSYQYDSINRLLRVDESGGSQVWHQRYVFDRYGNRALLSDAGTLPSVLSRTPTVVSVDSALPFVKNQWTDPSVYPPDANGNLTKVVFSGTNESYAYDAENRLIQAVTNQGTATYGYDAEGKRAKKTVGSATKYYSYGADGELVAETGVVTPMPCVRCFVTGDHLGLRGW